MVLALNFSVNQSNELDASNFFKRNKEAGPSFIISGLSVILRIEEHRLPSPAARSSASDQGVRLPSSRLRDLPERL
jgi:hypothetical protein